MSNKLFYIFIFLSNIFLHSSLAEQIEKKGFFAEPHRVISDLHYVSPMFNKDFRKFDNRINFFGSLLGGPVFAILEDQFDKNKILGNIGVDLGIELALARYVYFAFAVSQYNLIGGPGQHVLGYKFKVMFGGILDIKDAPLTKIYLLYRDNQLQLGYGLSDGFGYYSRNIGLGVSTSVWKGIEVGGESFFSLMHTGTTSDAIGIRDYGIVVTQFFIKFTF